MTIENVENIPRPELIEALHRLEESNARYADLYNFAPVGYCTLDRAGSIQEINLTGAALLETPKDQLIGRSFISFVADKDAQSFSAHMIRCVDVDARVISDLTVPLKDGVLRTVRIITDPVPNDSGPTVAYRTALIDITEERRFEDELLLLSNLGAALASEIDHVKALDAAAHTLVPALADLLKIDLMDDDGRMERILVLFADPAKQNAFAGPLKQFSPRPGWRTLQATVIQSGQPIMLVDVPNGLREQIAHDEKHANLIRAAGLRSMMVLPLAVRNSTFGALTFAMAESGRRYSTSSFRLAGTIAGRISAAVDSARLSESRQKAIHARDAILAVVSHDLRNSLNVIQLKAHLMLEHPDTQVRADAVFLQRRATEMVRLIQDLLDISSIEAGQLRLEKSRQPVVPIVKKAVETFEDQAQRKSLKFESEFGLGEDVLVDCDSERIQQVLGNLIGNAIKFTESGGSISLRVEQQNGNVYFSVRDTGSGIPSADLSHVFERFWRVGKTALKGTGTGLGLSIAKGVVDNHGGRIWAESKVGEGSTFFFTLPVAKSDRRLRPAG